MLMNDFFPNLNTRLRPCFWAMFSLLLFVQIIDGQEVQVQQAVSQEAMITALSSGEEEARLNAAVNWVARFEAGMVSDNFPAITALALAMRTDISPLVRALAARALGAARDARAAEPLVAALKSEREVAVRKAILYALARHPSPDVTAAILPWLNDKQSEIRATAVYALAEGHNPAAASALLDFLKKRRGDQDAFARAEAARALGQVGGREMLEPLIEALEKDKYQNVRREAAHALGRIATRQDEKAITSLRAATRSADPYLAAACDVALGLIQSRDL